MLKHCTDQVQLKYLTNLFINLCYSCTIENVTFMNLGLEGRNLVGKSHFTKIIMESNLMFCQGITLLYQDKLAYKDHKHLLIMNQINIIGENAGTKCPSTDSVGIHININTMKNLLIVINNSLFYNLKHAAINIKCRCYGSNTVIMENCTFEHNAGTNMIDLTPPIQRPLIEIGLSHDSKSDTFKNCLFKSNYNDHNIISIDWGEPEQAPH